MEVGRPRNSFEKAYPKMVGTGSRSSKAMSSVSEGAGSSSCFRMPVLCCRPIIRANRRTASRIARNGTDEAPHSRQSIASPQIALANQYWPVTAEASAGHPAPSLPKWFKSQVGTARPLRTGPSVSSSRQISRPSMQDRHSHRARESRSTRRVEVFLRREDGREIRTLLTNVSARGCRLRPQEELAIDERLRIEIPRLGSVAAIVRWSLEGNAGAEFIAQSDVWEEVARSGASTRFSSATPAAANSSDPDL